MTTRMLLATLTSVAMVLFTLSNTANAAVQTKAIDYEHDGVKLQGHLAWDDAVEGKRPGVLVVHEWWGLNDYAKGRAEQLAKLGYVAFALDMYGTGKVAEHAKEAGEWAGQIRQNVDAWRQRALLGLGVLRKNEHVDADRIAAIGYCFGGATVLQLAYVGAPIRGIVSFHGALPVPSDEQATMVKEKGIKLLICHGAVDPFIPAPTIAEFRTALDKANVDYQMVNYGGAQHSFTNPGVDEKGLDGAKYHEAADRRSWRHMQVFFDEIFGAE